VRDNFGFVHRSLVRLGVPRRDAQDALQQVFLVAWDKLDSIEPRCERAFLFGAALRVASHVRRSQVRRREVLHAEPIERLDPAPSVEDLLDRARARAVLAAILDAMPSKLRIVFVLHALEPVTMAEIAIRLDLPVGTVASRLRRAREHVQAATGWFATRSGAV
jgi:RNA polymerase sigma-70 factor (ECF subfamily)